MKTSPSSVAFIFKKFRRPCIVLAGVALSSVSLKAADQVWIQSNLNNEWSLTAPNWDAGLPWTNGNNAIFGGTGESVEVASDLTVNNLTFNSNGYSIVDANNDSLLNLTASSIITTATGVTATISESIAAGSLTKEGAGALVLSGANLFSGPVVINTGRVSVANNAALGDTIGTTTVSANGQLELQNGVTISGESLTLAGSGADFFGGLRTAENAIATWAGAVTLQAGGRVGSLGGGVLNISGPIQTGSSGNLIISATTSTAGLGTVRISGTANTYNGATTVFRGRLQIGAQDALPVGTTLDLDSTSAIEDSIFDLNGFNQTLGGLTRSGAAAGTGGSFITNTGNVEARLTVNQAAITSFSGILQDGTSVLGLTKSGAGSLTLSGNNTYSGSTLLTGVSNNEIVVASNTALGNTVGNTTVSAGARVTLANGIVVTGETISITGTGGNNNGALQTASAATAEWAGNIQATGTEARIGGGVGGTLIVSGVISGGSSTAILHSRANNATTVLNNVNTYTGDTQLFANAGTGARLIMGVNNALNPASRLSVIATQATVSMSLDLNGKTLALRGLDTAGNHLSGAVLFVENNGTPPSTLTLSDSTGTSIFAGRMRDGTGGLSFVKNGNSTQTFIAAQSYTGTTTVNAGTLQIGGAVSTLGINGSLASTNLILNGGTLALDNLGANNNSTNRLSDTANLSFRGGSFIYRGSDLATSSETVGNLILDPKRSTLTASYGSGQTATLNANQFTRSANGGTLLVNGQNLGQDATSTANVARIRLTTAPALVGTTPAITTGINTSVKNTQIVPFLLGESATASGGTGTATGVANTFVTYDPATGLRPLNLADEFTTNAFATGDNTQITANTTLTANTSINSLIVSGNTITINSGRSLNVASGAILFSNGTNPAINGGVLDFGTREGIVTTNAAGNTFITSLITGSAGLSYYGSGTVVMNQQSTYTGNTGLYVGTVIPQSSSLGTPNAPASGPFGTGTLILGGSAMRASTGSDVLLHNRVRFQADTTIINGSVNRSLTFAGDVTLTDGTRTLTHQSATNTLFTGVIGDSGLGHGLTINGTSTGLVILSGNNTYTGPTSMTGSTTVLINGDQTTATGAILVSAGVLGGTGTLGGATTITSGGTLNPGDPNVLGGLGRLNLAQGLTLQAGALTTLQITSATFTSMDSFGGNAPGSPAYFAYILANATGQGNHDQLNITGTINQATGAKIQVLAESFVPTAGQIFNLLDWGAATGNTFSSNLGSSYRTGSEDNGFDLDLPELTGTGLSWDTTLFTSHGLIVVIPEPGRAFLLGLGLITLLLRRRRA
ncbi:beta strand repeat-containing protein [Prosthecobacter dejongeii]|uniref:Autotransporter-associated beta strand protein n=1 Tax=Prosthecobacter dejongeii TaxID=48465 RepID=A0A7W8DQP6_9BACT|nr:autotransporter-associated beta strand repeat-containing protein [Prosthecobacter dejongeii]MBB5039019.1 autotransporter-associated beta strand protein [Prosthecobacter dejongeii]